MNITQAEAIASLYQELIESVDKTRIPCPKRYHHRDTLFTHEQISSISLEDGQVKIEWCAYAGCGDYDEDETYQSLESLFD